MQIPHGGKSRTATARRRRAAVLSQRMHYGDSAAARSLLQRRRALVGIAKLGGHWRVQLMNAVRLRKHDQLRQAAAVKAELEQRRQTVECSLRLDAGQVAAVRGRNTAGAIGMAYVSQCHGLGIVRHAAGGRTSGSRTLSASRR
jgi:hypothetical protein